MKFHRVTKILYVLFHRIKIRVNLFDGKKRYLLVFFTINKTYVRHEAFAEFLHTFLFKDFLPKKSGNIAYCSIAKQNEGNPLIIGMVDLVFFIRFLRIMVGNSNSLITKRKIVKSIWWKLCANHSSCYFGNLFFNFGTFWLACSRINQSDSLQNKNIWSTDLTSFF